MPVPALDQRLAVAIGGIRRVPQIVRTIPVHQHLARDQPKIPRTRRLEDGIGRSRMHRAQHQRRGGAVPQQFVQKKVGDFGGMTDILKSDALSEMHNFPASPAIARHKTRSCRFAGNEYGSR